MEIVNKGILLADDVKFNDDIFSKTRGLMFSRPLKKGQALVLVADHESVMETTIHMMFVFFSIDVVWLDQNKVVVDMRKNVWSFTPLITPRKPAKYVVELPKNTLHHIKIGDQFQFIER